MKLLRYLLVTFLLGFYSLTVFAEPVNINTADAEVLVSQLRGIGPKSAQAIIAYRTKHGSFKSADDLANVKGIGLKTVAKNRDNIVVNTK